MGDISSIAERLRPFLRQVVRLRFKDGEVVEAKLLSVDQYDDGEIVYDVVSQIRPPTSERAGALSGNAYMSPIIELDSINPIDGLGSDVRAV